jgi:hypothetical protein
LMWLGCSRIGDDELAQPPFVVRRRAPSMGQW